MTSTSRLSDVPNALPKSDSELRDRFRKPTVFGNAFSVFSIFPSDTLLSTGHDDVASYEEVATEAWQRVGDSMRAALKMRCTPSETT